MKNYSFNRTVVQYSAAVILGGALFLAPVSAVKAEQSWQATFEEVCSKVDMSQTMSEKELEALIKSADKIEPEIQASNDPKKKVYLRRLKNCRSMYEFVIETKKPGK